MSDAAFRHECSAEGFGFAYRICGFNVDAVGVTAVVVSVKFAVYNVAAYAAELVAAFFVVIHLIKFPFLSFAVLRLKYCLHFSFEIFMIFVIGGASCYMQ